MQKIKVTTSTFTSTTKPVAEYVLRLEVLSGALLARYFRVLPESEYAGRTAATVLPPFDPTTTSLLRLVVTEPTYYAAAAVTESDAVEGKVLAEIGRHVFRPTIGSETIVGNGERHDFSAFVFPFSSSAVVSEPYNHFTESELVKGTVSRNGRLRAGQSIFFLYSDVATAPIDDWTIVYAESTPFVLEDLTGGSWSTAPSGFGVHSLLPEFAMTAPATVGQNDYATLSIALQRGGAAIAYSGEVVVEPVAGYAPKRRVSIVNGTGTFKVGALGLDVGDEVRVKVGTRTVTGLADASIPVVAA